MYEFNVIYWDFNKKVPTFYDVLPYFREEYISCKKKNRPITREQWKEFIRGKGIYRFCSKCEYEVLIVRWPPTDESYKLDIWEQIEANLDLITDILMEEYAGNS